MNKIKKFFYTGLIAILPLVITFYIFNWLFAIVINLISGTIITKTIRKIILLMFGSHGNELQFQILVYVISFLIIILFITLLGVTTRLMFISRLLKRIGTIIEKIPVIKTIYTTSRQIIDMVYSSEGEFSYKKVVAVEYPRKDMYVIGFMMADENRAFNEFLGDKKIANIFIPTSPNPTSGMLVCVPIEDVHLLNMTVEMAFKLVISGGYITEEGMKRINSYSSKE